MGVILLTALFGGVILGLIIIVVFVFVKGTKNYNNSEMINCLKCGKEYRLMYEGSDCPKCNTRNFKDSNGNLTM